MSISSILSTLEMTMDKEKVEEEGVEQELQEVEVAPASNMKHAESAGDERTKAPVNTSDATGAYDGRPAVKTHNLRIDAKSARNALILSEIIGQPVSKRQKRRQS